jgi:hypothetical protein
MHPTPLEKCEGFLVDDLDDREVGVVDRIERTGPDSSVTGLIVTSGWFGRRVVRVPVNAIDQLLPAQRRVIVDASRAQPLNHDDSRGGEPR